MLKRTIVGVALAVLLIAVLYLGAAAQTALFTLAGILSVREIGQVFKQKGHKPCLVPAYLFAAFFGVWILFLQELPFLLFFVVCVMITAAEHILNKNRSVMDCFCGMLCLLYPLLFLALLLSMRMQFENGIGTSALLMAFICPLAGDTLAYFVGSLIGKRPLCPSISPKKTVEGSLASFAGGMVGALLVYVLQPLFGTAAIPAFLCMLIGFVCGFTGQVGDLFASSIKRFAGIKDFGNLLPGHGGVLDRIDSVLFSAPVVYLAISTYVVYFAA